MPSANYLLIRQAMQDEVPIHATYDGLHRELCVHEIGLGPHGNEQILAFQFGGDTSRGPATSIEDEQRWRCMAVDGLSEVEIVEGDWRTAENRGRGNTCIEQSDFVVHP